MARVVVVAGPVGAGKTFAARSLVHDVYGIVRYVNQDTIAGGLAQFDPESARRRARSVRNSWLDETIEQGLDCGFESTLATDAVMDFLKQCIAGGSEVELHFLWLSSPALSIGRARQRLALGGPPFKESTIRRVYERGLTNLVEAIRGRSVRWYVYNCSRSPISLIARGDETGSVTVADEAAWRVLREVVG